MESKFTLQDLFTVIRNKEKFEHFLSHNELVPLGEGAMCMNCGKHCTVFIKKDSTLLFGKYAYCNSCKWHCSLAKDTVFFNSSLDPEDVMIFVYFFCVLLLADTCLSLEVLHELTGFARSVILEWHNLCSEVCRVKVDGSECRKEVHDPFVNQNLNKSILLSYTLKFPVHSFKERFFLFLRHVAEIYPGPFKCCNTTETPFVSCGIKTEKDDDVPVMGQREVDIPIIIKTELDVHDGLVSDKEYQPLEIDKEDVDLEDNFTAEEEEEEEDFQPPKKKSKGETLSQDAEEIESVFSPEMSPAHLLSRESCQVANNVANNASSQAASEDTEEEWDEEALRDSNATPIQWDRDTTWVLLETYEKFMEKFSKNSFSQMKIWNKIASSLDDRDFKYTGEQCKKKLESMKLRYQEIKRGYQKTGNVGTTWEFYDIMDELFTDDTVAKSVPQVSAVKSIPKLLAAKSVPPATGRFHTRQLVAATGFRHWLPSVKGPGNCKQLVSTTDSRHSLSWLSVKRMASLNEELLLFALLVKQKERRTQKRRMDVHKMLSSRVDRGLYHTLYNDLCADEKKFFNYFRMTKPSFEELLSFVRRDITGIDTNMRRSIKPEEKLAVTLRYLGSGATMTDLHYQYKLGISTISNIIRQVCKAIWERVKPVCFPKVTERFWLETAAQFYQRTNFPNCLGALDGKHIRVIKPENTGSLYYNYKNYFSILLLALCDASYKFVFIDVGAYEKSSDTTVFKENVFFKKLENQTLNIPPPQESHSGFETPMPFVFVADEAFGLSQHILRPYAGKFLSEKKRIFNYRLSRARRHIECSFGILANKWRIFHRPLNVDLALAEDIVKVCCVLHNFVRERDGVQFEDTLTYEGLFEMEAAAGPTSRLARNLRDKFADYFVSDIGAVPWQLDRI